MADIKPLKEYIIKFKFEKDLDRVYSFRIKAKSVATAKSSFLAKYRKRYKHTPFIKSVTEN